MGSWHSSFINLVVSTDPDMNYIINHLQLLVRQYLLFQLQNCRDQLQPKQTFHKVFIASFCYFSLKRADLSVPRWQRRRWKRRRGCPRQCGAGWTGPGRRTCDTSSGQHCWSRTPCSDLPQDYQNGWKGCAGWTDWDLFSKLSIPNWPRLRFFRSKLTKFCFFLVYIPSW